MTTCHQLDFMAKGMASTTQNETHASADRCWVGQEKCKRLLE
jgi:hypothetical protein